MTNIGGMILSENQGAIGPLATKGEGGINERLC